MGKDAPTPIYPMDGEDKRGYQVRVRKYMCPIKKNILLKRKNNVTKSIAEKTTDLQNDTFAW